MSMAVLTGSLPPKRSLRLPPVVGGLTTPPDDMHTASAEKQQPPVLPSYKPRKSRQSPKAALAEFTAQITCLLWFEPTAKLRAIDHGACPLALVPESVPSPGFRKWVSTVLATTQVSLHVVLLALLFVYRLKRATPLVQGKPGSEYRLLTIALMLANKYLDDNTYTNKTWADVSGIPVHDIHVMEVEFLSNVRYNLFVRNTDWKQWHSRMGAYADFYSRASQMPFETDLSVSPNVYHSPHTPTSPLKDAWPNLPRLPSPQSRTSHSYPYATQLSPRQLAFRLDPLAANRKRPSVDVQDEQPSKKMALPLPHMPLPLTGQQVGQPAQTLPGQLPQQLSAQPSQQLSGQSSHQTLCPVVSAPYLSQLPPPSRVLPPVYPSWNTPQSLPSQPLPVQQMHSQPTRPQPQQTLPPQPTLPSLPQTLPPVTISLPQPTLLYTDTQNHQSPFPGAVSNASPAVSPYSFSTHMPTPTASKTVPATAYPPYSSHTPTHLSPAANLLLENRPSPYRPLRAVNTLLYPPPSGLSGFGASEGRPLSVDQMRYQPVSKVPAPRTGVLPYLPPPEGGASAGGSGWEQQAPLLPPLQSLPPLSMPCGGYGYRVS